MLYLFYFHLFLLCTGNGGQQIGKWAQSDLDVDAPPKSNKQTNNQQIGNSCDTDMVTLFLPNVCCPWVCFLQFAGVSDMAYGVVSVNVLLRRSRN